MLGYAKDHPGETHYYSDGFYLGGVVNGYQTSQVNTDGETVIVWNSGKKKPLYKIWNYFKYLNDNQKHGADLTISYLGDVKIQ